MRRKNSTCQKRSLVEVSKSLFLTVEIDSWLCQLMISLNPTKIALSCRIIISPCHMMLLFVLKNSLDPKHCFSYAWLLSKMCRKNSACQKRSLVEVWKRLFLTVQIDSWLCQLMISLNPTKIALSCRIIVSMCGMMQRFLGP